MPTILLRLLLLAVFALPLAACGQAQPTAAPDPDIASTTQPSTVPAQSSATPEVAAVAVVKALATGDTAGLLPLVAAEMPMREAEIQDMQQRWHNAQVRNGICGGPVTSTEAVETSQRGESIVVRVLTRCAEKDGPSSLGRGGMDLTLTPVDGGYQVLDWEMVDGIELRDRYADY